MDVTKLRDAPKDMHILAKIATWGFVACGMRYEQTGSKWVELWHDGNNWKPWHGSEKTSCTSDPSLTVFEWAHLPTQTFK